MGITPRAAPLFEIIDWTAWGGRQMRSREHFADVPEELRPEAGVSIAADARLDNRDDLIRTLGVAGAGRSAPSDSLLILHAWRKWGIDCPARLTGDFAFAIRDDGQRILFCARDHIGARPLFYSRAAGTCIVASDIRDVLAVPGVSDAPDEYAVAETLAFGRRASDRTCFASIKRLAPGHCLIATPGSQRTARYWFPANAPDIRLKSDRDYDEAGRELLGRAVRDRLRGSSHVGVHLSGGLDSSSVTVLAARELRTQGRQAPSVFSWHVPPDAQSRTTREFTKIEAVCSQEGLEPEYCPTSADDILGALAMDETRDAVDSVLRVEPAILRRASCRGVDLMLTGWGGDEGLSSSGQGFELELALRGRWPSLYRHARQASDRPLRWIAHQLLGSIAPELRQGLIRLRGKLDEERRPRHYLHARFNRHLKAVRRPRRLWPSVRANLEDYWQSGAHVERIEACYAHGRRAGIVYAHPLLDRRVLEFAAGLPPDQFVRGPWKRWIMRKAMEPMLPAEVCWHELESTEPVLQEHHLRCFQDALAAAVDLVKNASLSPSRTRYVDMVRLKRELSPEYIYSHQRVGALAATVRWLDF